MPPVAAELPPLLAEVVPAAWEPPTPLLVVPPTKFVPCVAPPVVPPPPTPDPEVVGSDEQPARDKMAGMHTARRTTFSRDIGAPGRGDCEWGVADTPFERLIVP